MVKYTTPVCDQLFALLVPCMCRCIRMQLQELNDKDCRTEYFKLTRVSATGILEMQCMPKMIKINTVGHWSLIFLLSDYQSSRH